MFGPRDPKRIGRKPGIRIRRFREFRFEGENEFNQFLRVFSKKKKKEKKTQPGKLHFTFFSPRNLVRAVIYTEGG